MALIRLVYVSTAVEPFTEDSLGELVERAAATNASLGVTGALLFGGGNFLQVLEGDEDEVELLFSRIETDPRHTWVEVFQREQVYERLFAEWSMTLCNFDETSSVDRKDFQVIRRFLDSCAVDDSEATRGLINYFSSRSAELAA